MRSSASSLERSTSKRIFSRGFRASRSSVSPTVPARRRSTAFAVAWSRPRSTGLSIGGSPSISPRPHCARKDRDSIFPSRLPCSVRPGSFLPERLVDHAAVGELGLDGRVRPVSGTLAVAEGARRAGLARVVCAAESAPEAALAGIEPVPVRNLTEVVAYFRGEIEAPSYEPLPEDADEPLAADLADVRGQERARRALEIAATGSHNVLLMGPPGTGQYDARAPLAGNSPRAHASRGVGGDANPLRCGPPASGRALVSGAPFRAPHHGASAPAIVGGGSSPRPGEVSLAHRGVLLLDELPEFPRSVLESLRQPLEDGVGAVARVGGDALFPARFRLVGTMNMCPVAGGAIRLPSAGVRPSGSWRIGRSSRVRFSIVSISPSRCHGRGRPSSPHPRPSRRPMCAGAFSKRASGCGPPYRAETEPRLRAVVERSRPAAALG